MVDDVERRLSPLFDALNCETLPAPIVELLIVLTRGKFLTLLVSTTQALIDGMFVFAAMEARDRPAALAIHVDLLTRGSQTTDIALWMSGLKQLITRL
jgi:protein transport protein SEC31